MEEREDGADDEFLSLIEAAEADAIAAGKRQKLSAAGAGDGARKDIQEEEGSYMAALRGSRSSLWQRQQQQQLGPKKKAGGGTGSISGSNVTVPPFTASAGSGDGACFKCGMTGHWARECGGGQGGSGDRTEGLVAEKPCPCGSGTCLVLTSNTAKNPGRKFYRCPIKEENGGCNFFEWFDSPSSGFSSSVIAPNHQSNVSIPVLLCPCGAGPCLILVSKTGKNEGQKYYKCPINEGSGSCGFFKWCSEYSSVSKQSASPQFQGTSKYFNSQSSVDRSNSSCFKCGQDGHWARDCQSQSPYSISCDSKTQLSSSGSGSCFKCGKAGHWARDCPAQNSVASAGGGKRVFDSYKSSFTC